MRQTEQRAFKNNYPGLRPFLNTTVIILTNLNTPGPIMSNLADPKFREVKERQGGSHIRSADLFRLDDRTIISKLALS